MDCERRNEDALATPGASSGEIGCGGINSRYRLFLWTCTGDEVFFRQMQVNTPLVISTSEATSAIEIVDRCIGWASVKLHPPEYSSSI
jgi:hypothetical protein